MSESWKQYHGVPSLSKNSKAASCVATAACIGSLAPSSQGRSKVPVSKTSLPGQLKLCQ